MCVGDKKVAGAVAVAVAVAGACSQLYALHTACVWRASIHQRQCGTGLTEEKEETKRVIHLVSLYRSVYLSISLSYEMYICM